MQFCYGPFTHSTGEITSCQLTVRREQNSRGRSQIETHRLTLRGMVKADGQAAVNARAQAIRNAYLMDGFDAALLRTDGVATTQQLLNSPSISGVRVVEPPSFPTEGGQAHYATGLPFSIVLEAEYLYNDSDPLMAYQETIRADGDGGPIRVLRPVDNGVWVEQQVTTHSPVVVYQSGEAVGSVSYPLANLPIYPDRILNPSQDRTIEEMTPEDRGNGYLAYPIRWAYRMTFATAPSLPHPELR